MKNNFVKMMRNLVYPVCIVSGKRNNNRHAITVSSVTSVSLDPESLLVCINSGAFIKEALFIGAKLNINFLSPEQKEVASLCSTKGNANKRFDNDLWTYDIDDNPFLKHSNAVAFSTVVNIVNHATHIIVIVSVDKVILNDRAQPGPLLYGNGSYLNIGGN